MTRVTSRSEPLFLSVRVRLRFASTQIIRFSSGSLLAILKNTVGVRLRFDKNSVKPVYKSPVRVLFDSLVLTQHCIQLPILQMQEYIPVLVRLRKPRSYQKLSKENNRKEILGRTKSIYAMHVSHIPQLLKLFYLKPKKFVVVKTCHSS